jgi:hypothetical protein
MKARIEWTHNPGSPDAVDAGCTCPAIDNHHGEGMSYSDGPRWWVNGGCPLHDPSEEEGETLTRDQASDWTLRLAEALDPPPGSNELLWALLERFRSELVVETPSQYADRLRKPYKEPEVLDGETPEQYTDRTGIKMGQQR